MMSCGNCSQKLSYFYRQLCAKVISKKLMREFEKGIPVLLCKMEKIFPPGFFNVMQHLLVHLPWEALVGRPVQFRWMYPAERELKKLRAMVRNKARVEACIAEAFAIKEISNFSSKYFVEKHNVNAPSMRYHTVSEPPNSKLEIFKWKGKGVGASSHHHVDYTEHKSIMLYMFTNMEEVQPYFP